jgi:peptide/nickel transport system substrate-binding protein
MKKRRKQMNARISGKTWSRRIIINALLILAATFGSSHAQPAKTDLKIGMAAGLSAADPHYHLLATNMSVLAHIFESLVHQDEQQHPRPGLATSWHLVDPTTWQFDLRHGVLFQDGSEFTAEDVAFSLRRVPLVPNSPSSFAVYLKGIASCEVVDPYTIRLHTDGPLPNLPINLSLIAIMSAHAAAGPAPEGKTTQQLNAGQGTIGTGPYRFVSFIPGDRVVLARNPQYWGGTEPWERVTITAITNGASRTAALLSGDVDAVEKLVGDDLPRVNADTATTAIVAASNSVSYIELDQAREPSPGVSGGSGKNPMRDVRVRHALSLALNREALSERIMGGLGEPASELANPTMFGAAGLEPAPFDPELAKHLLAEAGYPDGFTLVLASTKGFYVQDAQMAQAIAAYWTRIGVRTSVDALPPSNYYARRNNNEFSAFYQSSSIMSGQAADLLPIVIGTRDLAHGSGQINFAGYSNPIVDSLINQANRTVDDAARAALVEQASRIVYAQDYAVLPIYVERVAYGVRKPLTFTPRADKWITAMQIRPPWGASHLTPN